MLEFYSSSTATVDSKRAFAECLVNALGEKKPDCNLIIFYTTMGHNFRDILSEAHRLCPHAKVVGSTCAGVIGREGPNESMRALGIMAIKGPEEEFTLASKETIVNNDSYEVGAQLSKELRSRNPNINMILFHPSTVDILPAERAIQGIESVLPGTPIFGSLSVDNMKLESSFQFVDDQILEKGAVAVGFADPTLEVVAKANHGFSVIGEPFEVTRSESNHVFELDGKPAWRSLTERLGLQETAQTAEIVAFAVLGEELPEELHEEYGSRFIVRGGALKDADGSLYLHVPCSEGTRLWLMKRDEKGMFEGVDRLVRQIGRQLEGRKPFAVFHADCAARGKLRFNRILKDEIVRRMQYPLCGDENIPWLGMYGGGELTMLGGQNQIHLYTTSLYIILKRHGQPANKSFNR